MTSRARSEWITLYYCFRVLVWVEQTCSKSSSTVEILQELSKFSRAGHEIWKLRYMDSCVPLVFFSALVLFLCTNDLQKRQEKIRFWNCFTRMIFTWGWQEKSLLHACVTKYFLKAAEVCKMATIVRKKCFWILQLPTNWHLLHQRKWKTLDHTHSTMPFVLKLTHGFHVDKGEKKKRNFYLFDCCTLSTFSRVNDT